MLKNTDLFTQVYIYSSLDGSLETSAVLLYEPGSLFNQ